MDLAPDDPSLRDAYLALTSPALPAAEVATVREGVDFSGTPPTATALRQAGRDFVCRYARKTGALNKQITAAEAAYWRANNIDVVIVDEVYAARMLEGATAGRADARAAYNAVVAVGAPPVDGVIHFACDVDVTNDAQCAQVVSYLAAAAAEMHSITGQPLVSQVGLYAELDVINWAVAHLRGLRYRWQTYAWSRGIRSAGATLYQYLNGQTLGGVSVDYDRAYVADFGQWGAQDMPLTNADAATVWGHSIAYPPNSGDVPHQQPAYTAAQYLAGASVSLGRALQRLDALGKQHLALTGQLTAQAAAIATLTRALADLAGRVSGITPAQVEAFVTRLQTTVAEAIDQAVVDVDVTVHGDLTPPAPPA